MSKELSLLLVEDSDSDAALLVRELTLAGYEVHWKRVESSSDFCSALDSEPWNVILCDYSVPGFDGLAALRIFNDHHLDIPFIFVSGTISEDTAVDAMRSGAHDYVMKSKLKRLVPAVEREIREANERREKGLLLRQRSAIEEEMRRKDALFRSLILNSSDGILLLDKRGNVSYHSPSATRILGFKAEDAVPLGFYQLTYDDDREATHRFIDRLASTPGQISSYECRMNCANGSLRWFEIVGHNMISDENIGAMVVNFRDITDRKIADEEIRQSRERLRALAANIQNAREEERKRISREFHDVLGQSLTAVKMGLTLLHRKLTTKGRKISAKSLESEIGTLQAEIDHATQSVRKTLSKLRPELIDQLGLVAALSWDVGRFQTKTGLACTLTSNVDEIRLDPAVSIALFRIYQEATTNVVRHSQAKRVEVNVCVQQERVTLSIKDDGVGVDAGAELKPDSFGLIGMRERALLFGGTFEIRCEPTGGTTVLVSVPLKSVVNEQREVP